MAASKKSAGPKWSMRIGNVKGSLWLNETSNGKSFHSLNLVRSYQDSAGEWNDTSTFNLSDVLAAQKIIDLAAEKMIELSDESSG